MTIARPKPGRGTIAGRAFVLTVAVVLAVAGRAEAHSNQDWCSPTGPASPPCVVSATLNGSPLLATDPNFDIQIVSTPAASNNGYAGFIASMESYPGGSYSLGAGALSDTFSIVVDSGAVVPRVSFAYGSNVTFTRTAEAGGTYELTFTGTPTTVNDNSDCTFPSSGPSCPFEATSDFTGYLSAQISDYGGWSEPSQIDSFYGMDLWTNIDETALPPQLIPDPSTPGAEELVLQLADQHEYPGGALFTGFLHMRIPSDFLQTVYGIDDPSTVTDSALAASVGAGGGTVNVSVEPGGGALLVDITGLTFTTRTLTIHRGVITPLAPTGFKAHRISASRVTVSYRPVQPRGSQLLGYRIRCLAANGRTGAKVTTWTSPVTIRGLKRTHKYSCSMWAMSQAGTGKHSRSVTLARWR